MKTLRVKSKHAENLENGEMVAPDSIVEVDETTEHNQRLIQEGVLVPLEEDQEQEAPPKTEEEEASNKPAESFFEEA